MIAFMQKRFKPGKKELANYVKRTAALAKEAKAKLHWVHVPRE